AKVRSAFGLSLARAPSSKEAWTLEDCEIFLTRGDSGGVTHISVHRPTGNRSLWKGLFELLKRGDAVFCHTLCIQSGSSSTRSIWRAERTALLIEAEDPLSVVVGARYGDRSEHLLEQGRIVREELVVGGSVAGGNRVLRANPLGQYVAGPGIDEPHASIV